MVYEVNEYSGDGMTSRQYLSHFGIIGMKWGIRRFQNPDGTLTAAGKERYYGKEASDKLAKELRGYDSRLGPGGNKTKYVRLANSVPMKTIAASVRKHWDTARKFRDKCQDVENKFFKRKDYDHWVKRAAEEDWKAQNKNGTLEQEGWTFNDWLNLYRYDDFDQGGRTTRSFDMWLKESGEKEAEEYLKNEKMWTTASKQYSDNCKNAVKAFLGEHGDDTYENVTKFGGRTYATQHDLADKGVDIVTNIMNTWDTFSRDFKGSVPIEDLMYLVN